MIFEQVSGLKVNFSKSLLTGVNVSNSWLNEAALVLNFHVGNFPFVYLGLPIGRDPRKLDFWKRLSTLFFLDCRAGKVNFFRLVVV